MERKQEGIRLADVAAREEEGENKFNKAEKAKARRIESRKASEEAEQLALKLKEQLENAQKVQWKQKIK